MKFIKGQDCLLFVFASPVFSTVWVSECLLTWCDYKTKFIFFCGKSFCRYKFSLLILKNNSFMEIFTYHEIHHFKV